MTKETSALFVAGPPVVNALINDPAKHLDRFELGGWEIQTRCGAVDHAADSEEEAFRVHPALPLLSALIGVRGRAARGAHR
jgi:acetyl-CoA carboxylase carboxyltransferase component